MAGKGQKIQTEKKFQKEPHKGTKQKIPGAGKEIQKYRKLGKNIALNNNNQFSATKLKLVNVQ